MSQAVRTVYRGPTNYRGSRILVSAAGKRWRVEYDDGLSLDENHARGLEKALEALGWPKEGWAYGVYAGDYYFVRGVFSAKVEI